MPRHQSEIRADYDDTPEPSVRYREARREPTAWSPQTPTFRDEPWRHGPRFTLPADLEAELQALKAKLAVPEGGGTAVDPEQTRQYLAACAARIGVGA